MSEFDYLTFARVVALSLVVTGTGYWLLDIGAALYTKVTTAAKWSYVLAALGICSIAANYFTLSDEPEAAATARLILAIIFVGATIWTRNYKNNHKG